MTMYDPDNEHHLDYLAQHRARWTPEKEQALQASFARNGVGGKFGVRAVGTPELQRLKHVAQERGAFFTSDAILRELLKRRPLTR